MPPGGRFTLLQSRASYATTERPQHHSAAAQVEDLARLSFKRKPLYVGVHDSQAAATREGLEQGYCVVPADKRFLLLFTFLKKNASKKASGECSCSFGSLLFTCSAGVAFFLGPTD